ncbi:hypothetical protein POM88_046553 [Heracleum sosnowskyi]|uniref:RNase III domain-containing protein n=1 Tax=Heracleum sosnowskyi TaxID=360622 RepID=A0AAD8H7U9_9APIA|nr:hypothetical protein POM88_046553 [Heracleum sosnowskyi]
MIAVFLKKTVPDSTRLNLPVKKSEQSFSSRISPFHNFHSHLYHFQVKYVSSDVYLYTWTPEAMVELLCNKSIGFRRCRKCCWDSAKLGISTEKLACVAVRHELYKYVRHNSTALTEKVNEFLEVVHKEDRIVVHGGTMKAPKVLADIVESIIAAMYVDLKFDLKAMWVVVRGLLEPLITPDMLQQRPQPISTFLFIYTDSREAGTESEFDIEALLVELVAREEEASVAFQTYDAAKGEFKRMSNHLLRKLR